MKALEKLEMLENKKQQKSIIKNLNNHLAKLEQIKNKDEFNNWHTYLVSFVSSLIEPKSLQFQQILRNNIYSISAHHKTFEEEKSLVDINGGFYLFESAIPITRILPIKYI